MPETALYDLTLKYGADFDGFTCPHGLSDRRAAGMVERADAVT